MGSVNRLASGQSRGLFTERQVPVVGLQRQQVHGGDVPQPGDTLTLRQPLDIRLTRWERNQNSVSVHRGPLTFSIKIGERYVRYEPPRFADPWPAWEILPTTPWNNAIGADTGTPAASFQVVTKAWPADGIPFTHEGTPIELRAQARKLPNWKEDHLGVGRQTPAQPRQVDGAVGIGDADPDGRRAATSGGDPQNSATVPRRVNGNCRPSR